jgi:hypothetical protein
MDQHHIVDITHRTAFNPVEISMRQIYEYQAGEQACQLLAPDGTSAWPDSCLRSAQGNEHVASAFA